MKNILIIIALAIASTTMAYSLSPISAVVNFDSGENISVSVTNGSGPAIYTEDIEEMSPNSSGLLLFPVGVGSTAWDEIDEASVTTSHVLNVMDNGTIIAQFRLDYLVDVSARSGLISSELRVKGDTYIDGTLALSVGEFETLAEFSALTTNIMAFTGGGDIYDIEKDDINTDLLNNGVYYIVNASGENVLEFVDDYFPDIYPNEFIMFLKVDDRIILLNHDSRFLNGPGQG